MATYEHDPLLQVKDEKGDLHVFYPITKAANVDGLDEAIKAGAGEVGNDLSNHLTDENAHSALFAKKQDKITGKKGKFVGFTANDTVGEVDAPASGGSRIAMRFASDFAGCAWTLSGGGEQYTGTVDSSLTATVSVLGIGTTYTLSCVLGGVTYTAEVTTKDYYTALTMALEKFAATITVTVDSGSTVTATLGSTVLAKTSTGTAVFTVGKAGTWAIKATLDDQTAEGTVTISKSGESKALTLSYANVFGVVWDTSNSSTALTRLTPSTDPYGLVTRSVTTEPKPAVGTGAGSSPFDDYLPWSGMRECNLDYDGSVKAWKGDSGFARSNPYTMVWIPEFYVAFKANGAKKYFYIVDNAANGMTKHPGSGKFVGRYVMDNNCGSKTGNSPLINKTRNDFRSCALTGGDKEGSKWHLYDFATYCAIIWLYIIEFADWNCQNTIGAGVTKSEYSGAVRNGMTDTMIYHTGNSSAGSKECAVQYRWLENLWGNIRQFLDGIVAYNQQIYYWLDEAMYKDDSFTGAIGFGNIFESGWIKDLYVTTDGMLCPKTSGGSATTYIPDQANSTSTGWFVVYVGGAWSEGTAGGLLCFYGNLPSSGHSTYISARQMCEP